jgi:hypothetical protein
MHNYLQCMKKEGRGREEGGGGGRGRVGQMERHSKRIRKFEFSEVQHMNTSPFPFAFVDIKLFLLWELCNCLII